MRDRRSKGIQDTRLLSRYVAACMCAPSVLDVLNAVFVFAGTGVLHVHVYAARGFLKRPCS